MGVILGIIYVCILVCFLVLRTSKFFYHLSHLVAGFFDFKDCLKNIFFMFPTIQFQDSFASYFFFFRNM